MLPCQLHQGTHKRRTGYTLFPPSTSNTAEVKLPAGKILVASVAGEVPPGSLEVSRLWLREEPFSNPSSDWRLRRLRGSGGVS